MVTVFHPDPERLASLGYEPPVTHVPAIFESSGRYCREHNRYLRERSLAEWHPGLGSDIPRKRTLKNIADKRHRLKVIKGFDWRDKEGRVLDRLVSKLFDARRVNAS